MVLTAVLFQFTKPSASVAFFKLDSFAGFEPFTTYVDGTNFSFQGIHDLASSANCSNVLGFRSFFNSSYHYFGSSLDLHQIIVTKSAVTGN